MTPEKEDVRRLQACLKACEAIPTDELVGMANDPIKGVFGRLAAKAIGERDRLQRIADARLSALVFTHNLKKTARQRAAMAEKQRAELIVSLENALEWIDAVPSDTQLPAMPGFDRDEVNQLISDIKKDRL